MGPGLKLQLHTAQQLRAVKSIYQQSPTFLAPGTSFMEEKLPMDQCREGCFGMSSALHILCAVISSIIITSSPPQSSGIRSQRLGTPGLDNARQVAIFLLPPAFLDWEPGPSYPSTLTPTLPSEFMGSAGEISLLQVGQSSRKIFFFLRRPLTIPLFILSFIQNIMWYSYHPGSSLEK